jgi:hypothetical protein
VGGLNEAGDRTLGRVHVVEPVVGADRLSVCGGPGAVARAGKSNARSARRALYLTSESGTGAQTCDDGCADRNHEFVAHVSPLSSPLDEPKLLRGARVVNQCPSIELVRSAHD